MFTKIGMGLAMAVLSLGLSTSALAETLRYAHVGAEGDLQTRYASEAAQAIQEATDGNINVQVFPASQLGGVAEMVDGVRMGSIDLGHHDFASLARVVPEAAVFNAPYIYRNAEHALHATAPDSPAVQKINQQLIEKGGVRIIGRIYRGKRHISSNFAVKSPDDLSREPFRAVPLDLWVSMVKGFGATPTPVAVSELPTALMTGLVVGQENPLTMINANQLYEVQSHVSLTGHMDSVLAIFMNERKWQSLEESDRQAIETVLDDKAEQSLQWAQTSESELIQTLQDKGMTILGEEDGLDVAAFRDQVRAQIDKDFPDFKPYIEMIAEVE
ncbi:TRAP transporter substrate-binding protein [Kushneria aurantia]|uniref:TRAP transporter substrate-binding protein n=1 Tax=Kushneria aurantia TaxID=504092 RepID=A0ABV6G355_9GAMM|nr:TRAP transporter substrate-binding protein [Kushneria aurantia]